MGRNSESYLFLTLIFVTVVILSSSCGRKEGTEIKRAVIRYANFEALPAQIAVNKAIVDEFNRRHSNIYVKYEPVPTMDKILVEIAGGSAPDTLYWCAMAPLVEGRQVLDLIPFIKTDKDINLHDYFSVCVDNFKYGESLYALPLHFGVSALVYNKTMFDKAGLAFPDETWTWKDYLTTAKELTKDLNNDGKTDQFGTSRPHPWFLILNFGGKILREEDGECVIDNQESKEALQYLVDLYREGVTPTTVEIEQETRGIIQLFMSGRLGMFIASAFMLPTLEEIKDFEWDIAPVPRREGKNRVTDFGAGGLCISAQTKYPKETFEFIKFYCGEQGQKVLAKGRNCVPALKSIAYSSEYFCQRPPEHIKVFVDAAEYAIFSPRLVWLDEFLNTVLKRQMDLLFLGQQTPEGAIKEIVKGARKFHKE